MSEELRAQMASLREIAPILNKATDESTAAVKSVEVFLKDIGLGISCESQAYEETKLSEKDEDLDDEQYEAMAAGSLFHRHGALAYRRNRLGEFSIVVIHTILYSPSGGRADDWQISDEVVTPWPSCSREVKLRAVVALPSLLENIGRRATHLAQAASLASGLASSAIGSPEEPSPEPSRKSPTLPRRKTSGK